ncbi:MAG TPA: polysaccharide deacetylase family protein [Methylophilus sp.]|uniref:polysaccharide deacetylase family protein n=1 Tax=Methylophilus sp. TaxID=29541 RepID=UPI002CBA3A74|nr:polysaccharide deacetylase family protein [Methylophilus sp.]HSH86799.1 polysaccharide deacetylase family protein [Methylophilus sp.]
MTQFQGNIQSLLSRLKPSPLFIKASILLHVALLPCMVIAPTLWRWWLAVFLLNHLVISLIGLWPRSTLLGANWTQLPKAAALRNEIALTIDDGPEPGVTLPVLDILDRHQVKATFFHIGIKAAQYPELCREIIQRGHAIENHSQQHSVYFSMFGYKKMADEILAGQETLQRITGVRPRFFRAPAGLRNPFLDPVLKQLGLQLTSWSVRAFDTRVNNAEKVKTKLVEGVRPGAIVLLHDGNAARTKENQPIIVAVLPALLEAAKAKGLHFVTLPEAAN